MDEAEYCDRLALIDRGKIIALGTPGELKTHYMSEVVWELETDRLNESLALLREASGGVGGLPPFSEVAVFGNSLHIIAEKKEDLSLSIPPFLASNGIIHEEMVRVLKKAL